MTRRLFSTVLPFLAAALLLAARAQAHPAWGIAVDRGGQVYFSDLVNVWKVDARGGLSLLRAGRDHTHELNLDGDGNLYGAENSYDPATQKFYSAIWRLTPAGEFSYLLPPTDDPPEGTSIWKDREGNAYHFTHFPGRELLVLKRTPGGVVSALVGGERAAREYRQGGPYSAGGTAFGPDGALYFTHGASLSRLDAAGRLTELAHELRVEGAGGRPTVDGPQTSLLGVAVDARGDAYVADWGNRRVLKVAPDGKLTTLLRSEEPWSPGGVAERDGELYVLEHGVTPAHAPLGSRVRKLSRDGGVTTLAAVGAGAAPQASPTAPQASPTPAPRPAADARFKASGPARKIPYVLLGVGAALLVLFVAALFARSRRGGGLP